MQNILLTLSNTMKLVFLISWTIQNICSFFSLDFDNIKFEMESNRRSRSITFSWFSLWKWGNDNFFVSICNFMEWFLCRHWFFSTFDPIILVKMDVINYRMHVMIIQDWKLFSNHDFIFNKETFLITRLNIVYTNKNFKQVKESK